jgi:hypothetical protein
MSKLVLSGDTSGSVTLDAPAVSGTTTLTLPTTTGTVVVTSGAQTIEFADGSASTPSITNSGDTNTGMFFPAADTIAFAEGGTEAMRLTDTGLLQFNSGYGSVATAYGCRAWVNFNGQGTVAIRASGNVSSITDNGTGDYTVNFTTAMPDANYSVVASGRGDENINRGAGLMIDIPKYTVAPTTAAISLRTGIGATAVNNGVLHDSDFVFVSVFR